MVVFTVGGPYKSSAKLLFRYQYSSVAPASAARISATSCKCTCVLACCSHHDCEVSSQATDMESFGRVGIKSRTVGDLGNSSNIHSRSSEHDEEDEAGCSSQSSQRWYLCPKVKFHHFHKLPSNLHLSGSCLLSLHPFNLQLEIKMMIWSFPM